MFDELTNQFEDAIKAFKGEAKISDENVDEALKQVRRALLEADVSLSVVKDFIAEVRVKAVDFILSIQNKSCYFSLTLR